MRGVSFTVYLPVVVYRTSRYSELDRVPTISGPAREAGHPKKITNCEPTYNLTLFNQSDPTILTLTQGNIVGFFTGFKLTGSELFILRLGDLPL